MSLPTRHRAVWLTLMALVVVAHLLVTGRVADQMSEFDGAVAMPPRIEVAYVREMALAAPVAAGPAAMLARPSRSAPPRQPKAPEAMKAASAPLIAPSAAAASAADADGVALASAEPADAAPAPAPAPALALATTAEPPGADVSAASASAPDAAAEASAAHSVDGAASAAPPFVWPASTRMSYSLTGNYRGAVTGSAQVEWIHLGPRYQVHLDLLVGPDFAPIITRRMSSDGLLTAAGLAPQRYDQDTKIMLRDRQRATILFEPDTVVLTSGERRPSLAGVQDTASQFVQLTYVFGTRPELLRIGNSIDIPLALPRKVDVWTYDVVGEETLYTPFGELATIHLKPRPRPAPRSGDLTAEIWFAPQLRFLPVRIRIEQDADTHVDLMISKRPELGAP